MAVAFTRYDGSIESDLDPTYGSLEFNHWTWGKQEDGTFFSERKMIDSHDCSEEELGLTGDRQNSKFMPIFEKSIEEVKFYRKKLRCAKHVDDLSIYGDYSSHKAQ